MFEVKLLDEHHRIVELVWEGYVAPEEVPVATDCLEKVIKPFSGLPWRILVSMPDAIVFAPETQKMIVEQQKRALGLGCERAAGYVRNSAVVKMQLDRTKRESTLNEKEGRFFSREEALAFLHS